jgi:hypothetical protein
LLGKDEKMYLINKENGYIYSVVSGVNKENSNCTKEEYEKIKNIIENAPSAPSGFGYRLKENLEWELYELPQIQEEDMEEF